MTLKRKIQKIFINICNFSKEMATDKVGIYAAQSSFFIFLSFFPFTMLLLNIIGLTSGNEETLFKTINQYAPASIVPLLNQILTELYAHSSGAIISITVILAIWSSSKGFLSIEFGMSNIYKINQKRNYFVSRFICMLYTIIFIVTMNILLVLLVFGNKILHYVYYAIPALKKISLITFLGRYMFSFILLTMFFVVIFRVTNFKLTTTKKVLTGACFSSLGWLLFSYGMSIYVDKFSNLSYTYGSLTAVIIFMLWIYFSVYILFIGAEINKYLHPEIVNNVDL